MRSDRVVMRRRPGRGGLRMATGLAAVALAIGSASGCLARRPATRTTPSSHELMPGVAVSAAVHVQPGANAVIARAQMVSRRRDAVQLETAKDWCALTVKAYSDSTRSSPPVWSSDEVGPGEAPSACIHVIRGITLMPGDVETFEAGFPSSRILGPRLSEGKYYFTVVLNVDKPPLTTPELVAGSAILRR
jgi:hypothetical protein